MVKLPNKHNYRCPICEGGVEFLPLIDDFVVVGYQAYCHNCKREVEPIHAGSIRYKVVAAALAAKKLPQRFQQYILSGPRRASKKQEVVIDSKDAIEALFGK